MQILFFITVFGIYALLNYYIFRKTKAGKRCRVKGKKTPFAFLLVVLAFPVAMLTRDIFPLAVLKPMYFIGTSWLGIMLYLVLLFLLFDLFRLIARRRIFKTACCEATTAYLIAFALAVAGFVRFNNPKVITQEICIEKKAGNLREMTVVGISDLHLGMGIGKQRLKKYVELINAQNPDMVLIAGDIIDNTVRPLMEEKMYEEFRQIQAPKGIYACLGNHEYMGDTAQGKEFYSLAGIHLLIDESTKVDSTLVIVGRDDYKFGKNRRPLADLLSDRDKSLPVILLDHEPQHLEEAEKAGVDLQFSGHTHNGQMFPGNLIAKRIFELPAGYKKRGATNFFVSSGLGIWGPLFRIGTESDLAVFKISFIQNN